MRIDLFFFFNKYMEKKMDREFFQIKRYLRDINKNYVNFV